VRRPDCLSGERDSISLRSANDTLTRKETRCRRAAPVRSELRFSSNNYFGRWCAAARNRS